jgi:hypothetical protein
MISKIVRTSPIPYWKGKNRGNLSVQYITRPPTKSDNEGANVELWVHDGTRITRDAQRVPTTQ